MNEHQYKKLMRNFTITWWVLGIVTVCIFLCIALLMFQSHGKVYNYIGEKGDTGAQGPVGEPGEDGATILHTEKVIVNQPTPGPSGPAGPQGVQGEQGQPGLNGRDFDFRWNPETQAFEKQWTGDRFWTEVVKGCEVANTCEADNGSGESDN